MARLTKDIICNRKAQLLSRFKTIAIMDDDCLEKTFYKTFPHLAKNEAPAFTHGKRAMLITKAVEDSFPDHEL